MSEIQTETRPVDFDIPDHDDPTRSILLLTEPQGMTAEAIRAVRTRLIAQHVRMGRRALAICSVAPSAQASFVAANLAVALAQVEIRTLLVETDLRHPRLAEMFGLPESDLGLSDALLDEAIDTSDIVRQMPLQTLSIVTAGRDPAAGAEAMGSARFASIANRFLREHDLTIFTTTPSNRSADAQRVASVAGYALIVARKDRSYIRDIEVLSNALKADGATIAGSVLISG
jgi:Mrp family chromosome partitioning ATPase